MNIEQSPRYMKALQKIARLNPSQKAIFNAGLLHAKFADENMRKELISMRDAAVDLERQRNLGQAQERLGLGREAFAAQTDLSNQARDVNERAANLNERDTKLSELLSLGGAVTSTVQGYQNMKNKIALAKKYRGLGNYLTSGLD